MSKNDHFSDTIQIIVEAGKLKYKYASDGANADSHDSHRDRHVKWSCADGDFTIVFGGHTPFAHPSYSKEKRQLLSILVRSNAKKNETYKYSVVVEQQDNKHVTDDPEVVIN